MRRRLALLSLLLLPAVAGAQAPKELPGHESGSTVLLPNGWRISPAGRHLSLDDLPMEMALSPDGRTLVVTNDGYSKPILSVVDVPHFRVRARVGIAHAWLGLAFHPDGTRLYSSGAAKGTIEEFAVEKGTLVPARSIPLRKGPADSFVGGLSLSPDGTRLYAVHVFGNVLSEVDLGGGAETRTLDLPEEPYTSVVSRDGGTIYVSLWGGAQVAVVDAGSLTLRATVPVGEHPNALALSKDGARLFVACANTNAVYVVDLKTLKSDEQISTALSPQAPPGSTPNGLGLSPDGGTLLVPNADNNTVAVVDVSIPGKSRVRGFIPTGWYPTAARFGADGKAIYILSGKGLTSAPNPRGPREPNYIGQMLLGSLSTLPTPTDDALAALTKTAQALYPLGEGARRPQPPAGSPIPAKVGAPSPIKHVFYVIRENRSYDQVLGDIGKGNSDPNLCLYGEDVTPNAHALAREFVLLDNFYVDAEVSADGHAFSTAAYAPDTIEKTWPMNYAKRGGSYITEGGTPVRNPYGNIAAPARGYLWDAARRAKVTVRSYGEFVHRGSDPEADSGEGPVLPSVPGLEGLVHPAYPPWDLKIPDNARLEVWLEEFHRFESTGGLPSLSIIRLPNDHTSGTKPGAHTPRAMVAENDLALGRLVETISKSPYWKESAIFVLEDDAQDGPDHVDAHRSPAFVLSPFVRRGAVDSTLYTTSGLLHTIELILGLEPMSQYDAAATPFFTAFAAIPDLKPFEHRPPRVSIEETNDALAYGAALSETFDFSEADRVPSRAMNEILWKAARGAESPVPPPVRSAFVGTAASADADDD
jgi:YVTN family beta-propeller protein